MKRKMSSYNEKKIRLRSKAGIVVLAMLAVLVCASLCFAGAGDSSSDWTRFQNSEDNNGVTARAAVLNSEHAVSLWDNVKFDTAITPPLIVGDSLYVAGGNTVYQIHRRTGKVEKKAAVLRGSAGTAMHPMVYAEGRLYVVTDGEKEGVMIEAVDAGSLKHLWKSSEGFSGMGVTQLSYRKIGGKGYLYTGTGVYDHQREHYEEAQGSIPAKGIIRHYFCVSAKDGKVKWDLPDRERGFYWAGALITDKYAVFGSDNGDPGALDTDGSVIRTVDPLDGKKTISQVKNLKGDFRSTIVRSGNYIYAGTMGGRFYRIRISEDGVLSQPAADGSMTEDFSYIDLGESIRGAAVIHGGRAYVGVSNKKAGKHFYAVLDVSKELGQYSTIYRKYIEGPPVGAPLLSVPSEDSEKAGHLYFTCNVPPGGLYCFSDTKEQQTGGNVEKIFTPAGAQENFCISHLSISTDGIIYYKNDSNHLMAVAPRLLKSVDVLGSDGKNHLKWKKQGFQPGVTDYELKAQDTDSTINFNIGRIDDKTSFTLTADGKSQGDNTKVALGNKEKTEVLLKVKRGGLAANYRFIIKKITKKNADLSLLALTENGRYDDNVLGNFDEDTLNYKTKFLGKTKPSYKLWLLPSHPKAQVLVKAGDNVKKAQGKGLLKKGTRLDYDWQDQFDESRGYKIESYDLKKNTTVQVCVTSQDKSRSKNYYVTIVRKKDSGKPNPPKPAAVKGLKGKAGKKKITLSWKKTPKVKGYEIVIANDKKFRKGKKVVRLTAPKKALKTIKLKKGTKYVRIRGFIRREGKNIYGSYSKAIRLKVR